MGSDRTFIIGGGAVGGGVLLLILCSILLFFFMRSSSQEQPITPPSKTTTTTTTGGEGSAAAAEGGGTTGGGGGGTPPATRDDTARCPAFSDIPVGGSNCPASPYSYCSSDTIKNIYIVSGCAPSANLIRKLVAEGKITGEDDPKVIKCCKNPELCTAASIQSYPSVICESAPKTVYEGYCP